MAAPSYTTDLTTISQADESSGVWAEPTATGWQQLNAISYQETDFPIQGATTLYCMSATVKTGVGGLLADAGVSGVTIPTDGAFIVWCYWSAPGTLDTESNGGMRLICGSALNAFYWVKSGGKDLYPNPYGGWQCLVMGDPSQITTETAVGSPTSTRRYFGWAYNAPTSVPSKGNPFGVDALRYGRCESRINGGDLANGYATFAGFAALNDASSARWGLITAVEGGYKWRGLLTLGYSSAVDFRDSGTLILVANDKKVTSNFSKIEIRQSGSRVDWTSISFLALGTVARGNLEVIDNADVNIDSCSFTNMGTFTFLGNSTILNSSFNQCNLITTGGATFTGCTFYKTNDSTKAVIASSPANAALITNSTFVSSGTKHGLEIGGTAANMTLTNCTWTGYTADSGGNEAVYINIAEGSMNLTISGGNTPSVRTAGCSVTILSGSVNFTVTVKNSAVPPVAIEGARVLLLASDGTGPMPYEETVTIVNSSTTATVSHTAHGMATNDKVQIKGASLWQNNGVFSITRTNDNEYTYIMPEAPGSSPTGTIKATYVALFGTTNSSGFITDSRVFTSDQPVIGRVRKSTGSPIYKTSGIVGTIDSETGFSATIQMVPDE